MDLVKFSLFIMIHELQWLEKEVCQVDEGKRAYWEEKVLNNVSCMQTAKLSGISLWCNTSERDELDVYHLKSLKVF